MQCGGDHHRWRFQLRYISRILINILDIQIPAQRILANTSVILVDGIRTSIKSHKYNRYHVYFQTTQRLKSNAILLHHGDRFTTTTAIFCRPDLSTNWVILSHQMSRGRWWSYNNSIICMVICLPVGEVHTNNNWSLCGDSGTLVQVLWERFTNHEFLHWLSVVSFWRRWQIRDDSVAKFHRIVRLYHTAA
jgi:hypothetical protein